MIVKYGDGKIKEVIKPDGNEEALEKKLKQAEELEKKAGEEKPFWVKQD